MVYRTAPFSMTLTPNPRVRVKVGKVRKPYPNFQTVPLSMTLSDLWPTFQGHDNIQYPITRLIVSRVWSVHWFRFQWPCVDQWWTNRKSHMVGKVRKPYPNFQTVPLSMTLSDLWPTFQGHDNIQRPITRLIVSRVWSVHWFRFQW